MRFTILRASLRWPGETSPYPGSDFEQRLPDKPDRWAIDVDSIEELMDIIRTSDSSVIVAQNGWTQGEPELMIYDDYIE